MNGYKKYIVENEYYFYKYIKYLKPILATDQSQFKIFLEEMNDDINVDQKTRSSLSNFIEKNKIDDFLSKIHIDKFVNKVFSFLKYDFEIIAFRNKKSAWKILFNDINYKDESVNSNYNHDDILSMMHDGRDGMN